MKASSLVRATAAAATATTLVLGAAGAATANDDHASLRGERSDHSTVRGSGMADRTDTAAKRPITVNRVAGKPLVIRHRKTVGKAGVFASKHQNVSNVALKASISHNGKKVANVKYTPNGKGQLIGKFNVHRTDGRGTFKVGPTHISGEHADGSSFSYTDKTTGDFKVRSAIRGGVKIARRGSNHKARAHLDVYGAHGFTGYNGKAALQFKKNGHWRIFKILHLHNGRDVYRFRTSGKHTYRLKVPTTSKHVGGTTNGVKV